MKKNFLKITWLLLAAFISFTACNNDDDDDNGGTDTPLVEDGIYLKGAGTALTELNSKGRLSVAKNEVLQEERAALLEIYIAVKGGANGFSLVEVAGADQMVYGPASDFAEITGDALDAEEPTEGLWKGSYEETSTVFTVPEDGLYHVTIDTELKKVAVAKVVWGVIGAATPGGWSASTQFAEGAFDLNSMAQEGVDIELTKADYKFRYSNGWKIILDADYDLGSGNKGIKVNTNFGGSPTELVPGGDNISNDTPGIYKFTMNWSLESGFSATVEKTGDATIKDYSAVELGLIGSYLVAGDETSSGWDTTILLSAPEVNNTVYNWKWANVEVMVDSSFKIREGQTWDNMSVGYPSVTMDGAAADKFDTNADGNFVPLEDGTFDFTLTIDASTETYTFKAEAAGTPEPELYMLGDGCAAGWENTAALPMEGTDGNYTITAELTTGGYIKFIEVLGQWAPMYGTDDSGTSASGSLVYRPTEDDADPASIPTPDTDGTYTITVNTTDLTYSIEAAK